MHGHAKEHHSVRCAPLQCIVFLLFPSFFPKILIRIYNHKTFGSFDIIKPGREKYLLSCQLSFLSEHVFSCVNLFQCRCAQVIVDTFLDTVWNIYVFWICLKKCWKTGYSQGSQIEVFCIVHVNLELNHLQKIYVSAGDVPYPACSLPSPPKLPRNNNFRLVSVLTLGSLINRYT